MRMPILAAGIFMSAPALHATEYECRTATSVGTKDIESRNFTIDASAKGNWQGYLTHGERRYRVECYVTSGKIADFVCNVGRLERNAWTPVAIATTEVGAPNLALWLQSEEVDVSCVRKDLCGLE